MASLSCSASSAQSETLPQRMRMCSQSLGQRVAPRLAAVLDLLDHDDERTRRAAKRALESYKATGP